MESDNRLTEDALEELAVVAAAMAWLMDDRSIAHNVRLREVWPSPSPWRWAPIPGS